MRACKTPFDPETGKRLKVSMTFERKFLTQMKEHLAELRERGRASLTQIEAKLQKKIARRKEVNRAKQKRWYNKHKRVKNTIEQGV